MGNKLVVGVGNIHTSESLFSTGIHPDRLASSLSREECEQLMRVIKLVLLCSIKQGDTTLKDLLQSGGKSGYFTQGLQVYGHKGEPCRICGTPVVGTKHVQWAIFHCRQCQKQFSGTGGFVDQISVAPPGTKTGTEPVWMGGAAQHRPAWLMPQLMRYFSLFNSAWWTLAGRE